MLKCDNGHECEDGTKFCGECGSKTAQAIIKCSCGTDLIKADGVDPKFCTNCGTEVASTDDLNEVVDELQTLIKGDIWFDQDLVELPPAPEVDDAAIGGRVSDILKSSAVDGSEAIRPEPIFREVLQGQNALGVDLRQLAQHQAKLTEHGHLMLAPLLKAMLGIGRELIALRGDLTAQGNESRGRKSRAGGPAAHITKAEGPAAPATAESGADGELRGHALLLKAEGVWQKDENLRPTVLEVGHLEQHANAGHGLREIMAIRPALAAKVAQLTGLDLPAAS